MGRGTSCEEKRVPEQGSSHLLREMSSDVMVSDMEKFRMNEEKMANILRTQESALINGETLCSREGIGGTPSGRCGRRRCPALEGHA